MNHRYDLVLLFDVSDANPNGDPDAGNFPRVDPETGHGLVTDVCLKRKVRNFIQTTAEGKERIYFTEGVLHNLQHKEAYQALKLDDTKPTPNARDKARAWMCQNFFDIRTFGAVMSTGVNCGQVRGPVQLSFARSISPITISEHAITRTSITNEKDAKKERTMGRKFTVPYGLYRAHGSINPFLAKQTGFSEDDLLLFINALENAFTFDASAARPAGSMAVRGLYLFKHDYELGKAPSHTLFDTVAVKQKEGVAVPRSFQDYEVSIDEAAIPKGVCLIRQVG